MGAALGEVGGVLAMIGIVVAGVFLWAFLRVTVIAAVIERRRRRAYAQKVLERAMLNACAERQQREGS